MAKHEVDAEVLLIRMMQYQRWLEGRILRHQDQIKREPHINRAAIHGERVSAYAESLHKLREIVRTDDLFKSFGGSL